MGPDVRPVSLPLRPHCRMDTINSEILIDLVEERPVLWDNTIEIYKNKRLTFEAWREICVIIYEHFDELSDDEKNEFGKNIMKKWANMRDNWMKCQKKLTDYKPGAAVRKYTYYDQMSFLQKISRHRTSDLLHVPSTSTPKKHLKNTERDKDILGRKKKMKLESNEFDTELMELIGPAEKEEEESRVMSFFKGIAPTVEKFTDEEMVDFQFEVIKAVRNIQRNRASLYNQSQSAPQCSQCGHQERGYDDAGTSGAVASVVDPLHTSFIYKDEHGGR